MSKETLFNQLYGASDEKKSAIKKPFVCRNMKRKMQAAFDIACQHIDEKEMAVTKEYEKFENMDVTKVVETIKDIEDLKQTRDILIKEYALLFGKQLVEVED